MSTSAAGKLAAVQAKMREMQLDALIIPSSDPHMSEYVADHFSRRQFISGFTGSAGTAVITTKEAYLFTDGRYFTQAELELSAPWKLMKLGTEGFPSVKDFLVGGECKTVGVDPYVHSASEFIALRKALGAKSKSLIELADGSHPVDQIWSDRPAAPLGIVRDHPLPLAGKSRKEKLQDVRDVLRKHNTEALVVGALDETMWLFNLRGHDVQCNPVAISYAVVTANEAWLFIDERKLPSSLRSSLEDEGITVAPYPSLLPTVSERWQGKIMVDQETVNAAVYNSIPPSRRLDLPSPIVAWKASKNAAEVEGIRRSHIRDGAAVVSALCALEEALLSGQVRTEVEVDLLLAESRKAYGEGMFVEPSFPTIAGVNRNGAVIHYRLGGRRAAGFFPHAPTFLILHEMLLLIEFAPFLWCCRASGSSCATLTKDDMLLLDSGAQFLDGTTDVTRTMHFGVPNDHQREMYTRVLKGHINLASTVFPVGTPGCLLDSFARQALWKVGCDYLHGTGHGVGAALNVHEGPQRISSHLKATPLVAGMIVSNEPGYYEVGKFGIRIENLLLVVPARVSSLIPPGRAFLAFEPLTLIPIQKKLIKAELLSREEIEYLDAYHGRVRRTLSPLLPPKERRWLEEATSPLLDGEP